MDIKTAKAILHGLRPTQIDTLKAGEIPPGLLYELFDAAHANHDTGDALSCVTSYINDMLKAAKYLKDHPEWRPVTEDDIGRGPVRVEGGYTFDKYAGKVDVKGTTQHVVYDLGTEECFPEIFTCCEIAQ